MHLRARREARARRVPERRRAPRIASYERPGAVDLARASATYVGAQGGRGRGVRRVREVPVAADVKAGGAPRLGVLFRTHNWASCSSRMLAERSNPRQMSQRSVARLWVLQALRLAVPPETAAENSLFHLNHGSNSPIQSNYPIELHLSRQSLASFNRRTLGIRLEERNIIICEPNARCIVYASWDCTSPCVLGQFRRSGLLHLLTVRANPDRKPLCEPLNHKDITERKRQAKNETWFRVRMDQDLIASGSAARSGNYGP
ncbi:hypothetical protein C8J57DRAFT_1225865 [Mycena rebaudengoi]|nr:hypothetical protein C8J57DRAFT_1225865 [Mycena rebaudengoi]